jgi:hypothetical protein
LRARCDPARTVVSGGTNTRLGDRRDSIRAISIDLSGEYQRAIRAAPPVAAGAATLQPLRQARAPWQRCELDTLACDERGSRSSSAGRSQRTICGRRFRSGTGRSLPCGSGRLTRPRPQVHRLNKSRGQKGMGGRPSPETRGIRLKLRRSTARGQLARTQEPLVSRDFAQRGRGDVTTEIVVSPVRVRVSPTLDCANSAIHWLSGHACHPSGPRETGDERETGVVDSVGRGAAMWLRSSDSRQLEPKTTRVSGRGVAMATTGSSARSTTKRSRAPRRTAARAVPPRATASAPREEWILTSEGASY